VLDPTWLLTFAFRSVDSWRRRNVHRPGSCNAVRTIATAGIHLQCLALYYTTGLLKYLIRDL